MLTPWQKHFFHSGFLEIFLMAQKDFPTTVMQRATAKRGGSANVETRACPSMKKAAAFFLQAKEGWWLCDLTSAFSSCYFLHLWLAYFAHRSRLGFWKKNTPSKGCLGFASCSWRLCSTHQRKPEMFVPGNVSNYQTKTLDIPWTMSHTDWFIFPDPWFMAHEIWKKKTILLGWSSSTFLQKSPGSTGHKTSWNHIEKLDANGCFKSRHWVPTI